MAGISRLGSSGARRYFRGSCLGSSEEIMGSQNAPSAKGQEMSGESPYDGAAEGRSLVRCDCDGARGCRGRHFLETDLIRRSFRVQNPLFSRPALLRPELDPGGCEDNPRGGLLESCWIVRGVVNEGRQK